jgi:arginine decarboxylase
MPWTIEDSRDRYSVEHWSEGYFDVSADGQLICRPNPEEPNLSVNLSSVANKIVENGLALPVLVRFSGVLRHRVRHLAECFDRAISSHNFRGTYTAVYPIKVNQQSSVIDALLSEGGSRLGLEAGSKPELLAVLARSGPGGVVVCNGYKDREYVRIALMGLSLKHRVYLIVEKVSELKLIIRESRQLGIRPLLGVRIRLASIGNGNWQNTGGDKAKFGLSARDVLDVVELLRDENMLDCLRIMHFHMGSQIANLHDIQSGASEAAHYYAELKALGTAIDIVNIGGGLGVDYEGTRSRSYCSMNYSVQDYASTVVRTFAYVCRSRGVSHPDLFSESGRALTAHHAVLLMNVLDVEITPGQRQPAPPTSGDSAMIQEIWRAREALESRPPLEVYHELKHTLEKAQSMFQEGQLQLSERARIEQIFFSTCHLLRLRLNTSIRAHRDTVDELNEKLADKYFCNFSLFQSMPDHWAIDQIFPIVPLTRLSEEPNRRAILQDITCDSDGRIDAYVSQHAIEQSLPLHQVSENENYLLGVFMVGAYQEILGDIHNLFGDPHSVHVEIQQDGSFTLESIRRGDLVESVLRDVHFDKQDLLRAFKSKFDAAASLTTEQRANYYSEIERGFDGYTYLASP